MNTCTKYPPTLTLLDPADDSDDFNWLLWGGVGAGGIVVVILILIFTFKGKGKGKKEMSM